MALVVEERKPGEPFKLEHLPETPLNDDGTVNCRNCGLKIAFLPETFPADELPDGAPRSLNHSGCPKATAGESPAGPDAHTGLHETINRLDQAKVAAFYERKVKAAEAAAAK
jgi:hypothetical protein